ncbi:unnamed protein product [Sphagnum jensenii]|uniref:Homeobox domain-containing protein n=1 Tax=Sphagnum jensenii TaxID=128206 RepID=A0ABP0WKF7_9BRYO
MMTQEQCFEPLLPAQAETHESRHLRATPVYASNQGSPCGYLKTSATENQAAYGNWWNGTNVAQEHHLLQAAGTEEDASAGRSAIVHDLGQLHRETLVGDGSQGLLALSLSSQYQPQTSSSSLHLHSGRQALYAGEDISRIANCFATSRFLRAAQELLVEVCRVVAPMKRSKSTVHNMTNWPQQNMGLEISSSSSSAPLTPITYHPQCVAQNLVNTTAGNETREALLLKKENLLAILNEVEARHLRYQENFTVMMNSFNIHAGAETAMPYLDLAFQTMSRHFRTVRDATRKHLRVVTEALGEEDFSRAGRGETSRCQHIADNQLHCQQQALQQLGILQQHQSWRPQRGLPERAVTILRDWMTKHFLHPYPRDADKLSLAKQTCLTRSQVSNWFINARVRLWKPMVEEMYMEEQRIAAQEASERRQLAEAAGIPSKSLELFRRKLY